MGLLEAILSMSSVALVLFILGFILIVVEMFEPGFGFAGGIGIILLIGGVVLTAKTFVQGLILSIIIVVILGIMLSIVLYSATKGKMSKTLILKDSTNSEEGFNGTEDMHALLGKEGTTLTVLRPSGCVDIEGIHLDVVTGGEYVEKGVPIRVIEVEGNRIVVREIVSAGKA